MMRGAVFALVGVTGVALLGPARLSDRPNSEPFGPSPPEETVAPIPIRVYEYGFEPSKAVIKVGQVIVWRNIGKELHDITPRTRAGVRVWHRAEASGTARHLFDRPGVYPYYCSIHPSMHGRIVVR